MALVCMENEGWGGASVAGNRLMTLNVGAEECRMRTGLRLLIWQSPSLLSLEISKGSGGTVGPSWGILSRISYF